MHYKLSQRKKYKEKHKTDPYNNNPAWKIRHY